MAEVVALVDYGAGNLHSVENALRRVGANVTVTADPDVLRAADRLVLPGVGTMTVLHRIADTDIAGQLAYQDSIAAYHERLRRFYYPYLFDERSFTRADFAQIPRYETRRATGTLDAASLNALGILALLLLVAGRARMARIGARRRS